MPTPSVMRPPPSMTNGPSRAPSRTESACTSAEYLVFSRIEQTGHTALKSGSKPGRRGNQTSEIVGRMHG